MRVTLCVDALGPNPGGIGRYTWELCKGLAAHPAIEDLHFISHGRLISEPERLLMGERPKRGWWPQRLVGRLNRRRVVRETLVHGPNYFLPAGARRGVITLHDLSVFHYPETHPVERVQAFEHMLPRAIEQAAHIITDTETVRREVIEMFGVPEDRISSIWLGVEPRFAPRSSAELGPIVAGWGLKPGGYGLCVSTLEPRKRVGELLAAWRLLPPATRQSYPLVLAGGTGWRNDQLRAAIRVGEEEGWLRNLGFVEDELLPALYAGAAVFIYPSIYEGFGLPPIEAMASGVPVLVASSSCLPEVCGEAAQFIEPENVEHFVEQVQRALCDESSRADAIKNGLMRAGSFRWDRCIDDTVLAYRKAFRSN